MVIIFTFLLSLTHLYYVTSSKPPIFINYYGVLDGYYIFFNIGKPSDLAMFKVDLQSGVNILTNSFFRQEKSSTHQILSNNTITYKSIEYHVQKFKDYILIGESTELDSFLFFFLNSNESKIDTIGFSYKYDNINFSLIHKLKQNNIIEQNAFSLGPAYDSEDEGAMYLGGMPENYKKRRKKATCNVSNKYKSWGCNFQYIFIDNDINKGYYIDKYLTFDSLNKFITIPRDFFDFIVGNVFDKLLSNDICEIIEEKGMRKIKCKCKEIETIPDITFVVDDFLYVFQRLDLFENLAYATCYSYFQTNLTSNDDSIIMGCGFFKKYFTLFDYDNHVIEFYHDQDFKQRYFNFPNITRKKRKFQILIILIPLLTISSLYLLYKHIIG